MENKFEWDEHKNGSNIEKHGINFCDAIKVFDGPSLSMKDNRVDYGESRTIVIGLLRDRMVVVVYAIREDRIRIIPARKANEREQKKFQNRLAASGPYEGR